MEVGSWAKTPQAPGDPNTNEWQAGHHVFCSAPAAHMRPSEQVTASKLASA